MSEPIVYLNGRWLPKSQAHISVEDRGFLFGDGVYEVVRYYNQIGLAMTEHIDRMNQSLARIRIDLPPDFPGFGPMSDDLMRQNNLADASVYWQVTRGVAERVHHFPDPPPTATIYAIATPKPAFDPEMQVTKLRAILRDDIRWRHCSIKSVGLLPNVLDCQAAVDAGADEAILHRAGTVTEATARSVFIVENGELWTYPLDGRILDSITRRIAIDLARENGIFVHESPFSIERLMKAQEVIAAGTTTEIASVIAVDGQRVGDGAVGPVTQRLFDLFRANIAEKCCIGEDIPR